MRKDLESLYRDTLVILMFKKCLERLDVSTDLAQSTWTNEFADFNSFPLQKHLGKISAYINKISGVTMKLGLDENGELKVMPNFHSVFDAARFALSQYDLSLRITPLLMPTVWALPPVSAAAVCSSKTETARNTVTIQNVKRNETAENPTLHIAERYRNKWIIDGRDHGCFHNGANVASNIGYFLYRLYKNNLNHLPQVAPTVFPIEKRASVCTDTTCHFILILRSGMLNFP